VDKIMKKIVAAAVLAMVATSSFAGTPGRLYAGVDGGSTKVDGASGKETSYGGFVGYNFHRNFALEAGFRRLGKWDEPGNDLKIDQTALSVIGSVPLSQGFSLYGRLGANYLKIRKCSCSKNESGALYGVGLAYNFSETVGARVEAQRPSSDSTNVSVGLAIQF
jgi:opacity protein-like surface antigen